MKAVFTLLFLVLLTGAAHAAGAQSAHRILPGENRSFSDSLISKTVQGDDAFRYDKGPQAQLPGFWERFWSWIWNKWHALAGTTLGGSAFRYMLLIAAVALVIFAVIRILGMDRLFFLRKESPEIDPDYTEIPANIHEISFADRIDESISRRQYRLAVRLLYLQTLKNLSDRQLIHWKKEKTNADYLHELAQPMQPPFGQLTREFEYVWYGEFPIDEQAFSTIKNNFSAFAGQLEGHR